jgi:small subunit ribosomal protein S9
MMVAGSKKDKINGDALGTGRRKSSVARVRIRAGSGKIIVNKKDINEYFPNVKDQVTIHQPLAASGRAAEVDVLVRVHGGGTTGQSGAIRMGIARALVAFDEATFESMRDGSFLTRDARMSERKKPGLRGARRGTQFSKR